MTPSSLRSGGPLNNSPRKISSSSLLCRLLPVAAIVLTTAIAYFRLSLPSSAIQNNGTNPASLEDERIADRDHSSRNTQRLSRGVGGEVGGGSPHSECQTVVFFHVPKTGGESLNELWQGKGELGWRGYRHISLRVSGQFIEGLRSMEIEDQRRYLEDLRPWTEETPKRRHTVVELHCGTAISFMQAHSSLQTMRKAHEENDCGFFAFTVIRPPLDWVVSLYDDICHRRLSGHKDSCPQRADMTSKQEMLNFPHRDGITAYLTHGWNKWDSPGPVDEEAVQALAANLRSGLDMVGFTAEISQIRRYLTERFASPSGKLSPQESRLLDKSSKQNPNLFKTVHVSDFTPDETVRLNATIQLDWELYRRFEDDPRPWG